MNIILARNEALGQEAVKKLNGEGLNPKFHQLDLCDKASIDRLKNFMQSTYGGIDILVNNAGIAFKVISCIFRGSNSDISILPTVFCGANSERK